MAVDYKEKIKKLLALSKSSNLHEAKAALLKARELMAQHKIGEQDLKDVSASNVIYKLSQYTCSKRRNPWMATLANTIAGSYCCEMYVSRAKGKQTRKIIFIGLDGDIDICVMVFEYAVASVISYNDRLRRANKEFHTTKYINAMCDSYGAGFVVGVQEAFDKQNEEKASEEGWALVVQTPDEVKAKIQGMKRESMNSPSHRLVRDEYMRGINDGLKFDPKKRLNTASAS